MENQRTFLTIALLAISIIIYFKWIEFSNQSIPRVAVENASTEAVPIAPAQPSEKTVPAIQADYAALTNVLPSLGEEKAPSDPSQLITVNTDLIVAVINKRGGVIERLELKQEPLSTEKPEQGFPLLKDTPEETFIAEDGLFAADGLESANHLSEYSTPINTYDLGSDEQITIPLTWVSDKGIEFTKTITFKRDSYVVGIDYQVNNKSNIPWSGYLYAQFKRTEPASSGGGFGQLPSFTGGAIYEPEDKFQKIKFKEMLKEKLSLDANTGWVAMIQHYFVGAWIPQDGNKTFFTSANKKTNPDYRIGYKTKTPVVVASGQSGSLSTEVYLGSKEQSRLKKVEEENNIEGLALTVDFGMLTFIADPLFFVLNFIYSLTGNWGWAIILLTVLIKALFYPLSAASYKSMAGMKKLQPRMQTLKERYKDDRQKFQMEMMTLYKKEKINPAGGCLPILIQIPVFIALYWVLLESVELRQAPFALWWQDLSAPDPYYVLPILMGASMAAMQKLNPAVMDEIQKKVMMIMPFALTFLFLTFPQGLVLYWVVNNILSMAQQWYINKKHAV